MDTTRHSGLAWGAILAGALAAAAAFLVLVGFGSALGLATASAAPSWREASFLLWTISGLYLVLAVLVSFALGGYLAGRMHPYPPVPDLGENELRAGIHGLVVWAVAVLLGATLAAAGVQSLTPAAPTGGGAAGQASSPGVESLIAFELDKLFRSERRSTDRNLSYERSEAGRILLTSTRRGGIAADDRAYLGRLVSARTGLTPPEAEQRVAAVSEQAKQAISRARKAGILIGFMVTSGLLLGAAVSWFASQRGERDAYGDEISPYDSLFRAEGMGSWFAPPRRRVVVTRQEPPAI